MTKLHTRINLADVEDAAQARAGSSGADPARDDVVDGSLTVNAGDSHARDVPPVGARETALESAADLCRDARRAAHVGWSETGVLEDEAGDRLLGRVRSDRAPTASRQQCDETHDGWAGSPHGRHYCQAGSRSTTLSGARRFVLWRSSEKK